MKTIILKGKEKLGKTSILNMLVNQLEGRPLNDGCLTLDTKRIINYKGKNIAICTPGDSDLEINENLDFINKCQPDLSIMACRTKGKPLNALKASGYNLIYEKAENLDFNSFSTQCDFEKAIIDKNTRTVMSLINLIDKHL